MLPGLRVAACAVVESNEISAATTDADPAIPYFRGDIRRTVETLMAERLGISKDVCAQLLSHGLADVQDVHYTKGKHRDAKRAALRAWSSFLVDLCIAGEDADIIERPTRAA